jgi:hypothetical protein
MTRTSYVMLAIIAIIITGALAAAVYFQSSLATPTTRTWVSGVGDDANPCTRSHPCQTFARAISKTVSGGEINCADNGGFGIVTITKSITIDCTGTMASIMVAARDAAGVTVSAAGIRVTLRNLSINASGAGAIGVHVTHAAEVSIESCRISGATAAVQAGANAYVSIDRATLTGNSLAGVLIDGASSTAYISNSEISNNAVGVSVAATTARALLSDSNLFRNGTQLFAAGPIFSAGNNRLDPPSTVATMPVQTK